MTQTSTAPERPPRKRAPRTLREVEAATPTALAMMTRAQVDELPRAAAARRVEIMLAAHDTKWGLPELMAWFGVGRSAVSRWRWRQNAGDEVNGVRTVLPVPLAEKRRHPNGQRGPQWPLPQLLVWARELNRCDRHDYVPYPGGRKSPGRTPDAVKAAMGVAPSQQPRSAGKDGKAA